MWGKVLRGKESRCMQHDVPLWGKHYEQNPKRAPSVKEQFRFNNAFAAQYEASPAHNESLLRIELLQHLILLYQFQPKLLKNI
jgi:hypothetical protein